jgi:hypothetical protein
MGGLVPSGFVGSPFSGAQSRFCPKEVSYQCHMNCDEWRQKVNKDRKEKVNLTTPILLELADSRRFVSAPAQYGHLLRCSKNGQRKLAFHS